MDRQGLNDKSSSLRGQVYPSQQWPGRDVWSQCQSKGKKGRKRGFHVQLKYEVFIWHLERRQSICVSATSSGHLDLDMPSVCTGQSHLQVDLLQLWDVDSSLKPLKHGCHLGSEEGLVHPCTFKETQGPSLFLVIPNQKGERRLETFDESEPDICRN